jgi:hypothetical protein
MCSLDDLIVFCRFALRVVSHQPKLAIGLLKQTVRVEWLKA